MNKRLVCAVCCLVALVLVSMTAFAANKGIVTAQNGRQTIAHMSQKSSPYVDNDAPQATIFNNLATAYPLGVYWCCTGGTISGPLSIIGAEYWEAAGFTPSADATVTKVKVGVGYVTGNTTDVILTISADAGGVPGQTLKQWKASGLPIFGSCCTVVTKKNAGVAVKAGQLYWITVQTEADSDIWAAWNMNDSDQVNPQPTAFAQNGSWIGYLGVPAFSFKVIGQ